MPRGFLVKRTKKISPVSYRVREECTLTQGLSTPVYYRDMHCYIDRKQYGPAALPTDCSKVQSRVRLGGMLEAQCPPTLSPNRPVSPAYLDQDPSLQHLDRNMNSSSPVQAESFPEPSFTINGARMTFPLSLAEMTSKLGTLCKDRVLTAVKRPALANAKAKQTNAKKHKPLNSTSGDRRPSYRDEVTTSPVLGLKIKEIPEEDAKPRSNSPLGEFICQLCKEIYADPLTLAQHKCSRIIRVDYRCTECEKVFSCPANLASHRRWHKPRTNSADSDEILSTTSTVRENLIANIGDGRTPPPPPSDSVADEDMAFSCSLCGKKFRRQAYLRKHLALHKRQAATLEKTEQKEKKTKSNQSALQLSSSVKSEPLYLGRDAPVDTSSANEMFPCRFCGEEFFSSPGLTRHINKCHPTETKQVILSPQTG